MYRFSGNVAVVTRADEGMGLQIFYDLIAAAAEGFMLISSGARSASLVQPIKRQIGRRSGYTVWQDWSEVR